MELRPALLVLGESAAGVANPALSERPVTPQEWELGLRERLRDWSAMPMKVPVMDDIPYASYDVPVCLSRVAAGIRGATSCIVAKKSALNEKVRKVEMAAVSDDPEARWVDDSDLFYHGDACQTTVHAFIAYRDDNHISDRLADHLAGLLDQQINLLEVR